MLNLLKESSKKSPFQFKFSQTQTRGGRAQTDEIAPRGLKFSFALKQARLELVVEKRFFVVLFLAICLYIYGGETGNQWIYLLTSVAIAALILGFVMPLFQVLETNINFSLPQEAVARERLNLRVKVTRKGWWGALAQFLPVKWLLVNIQLVRLGDKENMLRPIMVEHLVNEAWVVAQTPRLRRGVYNLTGIELFSCYPFGLVWWTKRYLITDKFAEELSRGVEEASNIYSANRGATAARSQSFLPQMTVFPRINNVDGNFLFRLRAAGDSALFFSSSRPIAALSSASVRSLREFRIGDSPRFIHWPTSAKTGKLMIREFESEGLPGFDVLLDLTSDWKNEDQFELAISITLSLLQLGFRLGGSPELFVIPSLDEDLEKLPDVLTDLPPVARGIGWAAQVLARVEALTLQDPNYDVKVPVVGLQDSLAMLTVRPSNVEEVIAALEKASEDEAIAAGRKVERTEKKIPPHLLRQVDLWVMSRTYLEADIGREVTDPGKARIPLHALGSGDRRAGMITQPKASVPGRILSSLSEFEELSHL